MCAVCLVEQLYLEADLASIVWKLLAGEIVTIDDLAEVDPKFVSGLEVACCSSAGSCAVTCHHNGGCFGLTHII